MYFTYIVGFEKLAPFVRDIIICLLLSTVLKSPDTQSLIVKSSQSTTLCTSVHQYCGVWKPATTNVPGRWKTAVEKIN